jgi:hypothetical protein
LQSLESKWRWALKEVSDQKLQKSVWIGYAIQRWKRGSRTDFGIGNSYFVREINPKLRRFIL